MVSVCPVTSHKHNGRDSAKTMVIKTNYEVREMYRTEYGTKVYADGR